MSLDTEEAIVYAMNDIKGAILCLYDASGAETSEDIDILEETHKKLKAKLYKFGDKEKLKEIEDWID